MVSKNLYVPFRALGLVCDGLEGTGCTPCVYKRGLSVTITTPVDSARALHCYNMNLRLRAVSKPVPSGWLSKDSKICAVACHDDFTYAAFGNVIVLYRFMRPYTAWRVHEDPISLMIVVGNILVTVSQDEHRILSFRLPENYKDKPSELPEVVSDISLPADFKVSAICHPQTYVNKILVGALDGRCMLINLRSRSIVHEFPSFDAPVTILEPSPAIDTVAVGLGDGRVILHNFKYDESITTYVHGSGDEKRHDNNDKAEHEGNDAAPIRAISFRTDGTETMAVSDSVGNIILWDLNEKRMISAALRVHRGGSALTQFLEGEPILVTAGRSDNSMKVHIFDQTGGEARLLRFREGHRLPPTRVKFCGRSTTMMVSTGLDRELRLVSTVQDNKNKTFSQASLSKIGAKKRKRIRAARGIEVGAQDSSITGLLPVITDIATSTSKLRDDDFANIVTCHTNKEEAFTWQSKNARAFQHVLKPSPRPGKLKLLFDSIREGNNNNNGKKNKKAAQTKKERDAENRTACCTTISPCGNFSVVGSMDGRAHVYNLQSGTHLGAFEEPNEDTEKKKETEVWGFAHSGPLVGVAIDGLSDGLLTAGRRDRKIKYWKLRTRSRNLKAVIETKSDICKLVLCQNSDLVAVACDDNVVYIYDGQSHELARELRGHTGAITDVCFAGDGRRLVTSSMDGTLRTWDLVAGICIDTLTCSNAPTSVIVAPRGAFIATTHVDNVAVVLWVDQTKFVSIDAIKSAKDTDRNNNNLDLPALGNVLVESDGDDEDLEDDGSSNSESSNSNMDEDDDEEEGLKSLGPNLVTFSNKPTSQWTVLSNLSAIRERNKPQAAPKKPENVPFFIPTVPGLKVQFDLRKDDEEYANGSKGEEEEGFSDTSEFGKFVSRGRFREAEKLLYSMQPSGVDIEIRTLEGTSSLKGACKYFLDGLEKKERNFEITQAHLGVFLNAHGLELARMDGGKALIAQMCAAQEEGWRELRERFESVTALASYFSGQI